MSFDDKYFIEKLNLLPHPEGGFYRQICQSDETISFPRYDGQRLLWTSIYFLLRDGEVSHLHRLKSDELWYFHGGSALSIYIIDEQNNLQVRRLGLNVDNGEEPQILVPRGTIFGSKMNNPGFSLVGCMVAPGFDFHDFELIYRDDIIDKFPQHKDLITELTLQKNEQ